MRNSSLLNPAIFPLLCGLAGSFSLGCAHAPLVEAPSLPLRKVVLYRNGVAYFERDAVVSAPNVAFHVRESELGDFLASLSILEASGRTVKAAAYPVEGLISAHNSAHNQGGNPLRARTVTLELDGPPGKLAVGYIAHSPVWKPAYRVVILKDGKALLQSWAVIHNRSGEDWTDVKLSVVTGAPLAFSSTLGEAFIPTRPVLDDRGDSVAAIPTGTSVAAAAPTREARFHSNEKKRAGGPRSAAADVASARPGAARAYGLSGGGDSGDGEAFAASAQEADAYVPNAPPMPIEQAAVAQSGSMSRFDLPSAVTVPNGSATMALLTAKVVKGDVILLFAPDARVNESKQFPWRVARFTNEVGAALERGPLAVFGLGAFLGEGEMPALMAGSDATIPFALDRGVVVTALATSDPGASRVWGIRDGGLVLKSEQKYKTRYEVTSAAEVDEELRIRHQQAPGSKLQGPDGVKLEQEFGKSSVLVPLKVLAHGKSAIEIVQISEWEHRGEWFSPQAEMAMKALLADPKLAPEMKEKLTGLMGIRDRFAKFRRDKDAIYMELQGLEQEQSALRANLQSIEKNPQAADLRGRLVDRLSKAARRADDLAKRRIECDLAENLESVLFQERLKGLVYEGS